MLLHARVADLSVIGAQTNCVQIRIVSRPVSDTKSITPRNSTLSEKHATAFTANIAKAGPLQLYQ